MLSFLARLAIFVSFVISNVHVAASNVEYIIYPKENLPLRVVSDLASLIERLGGGKNRLYASIRPSREIIEYWVVTLNEQRVDFLRNTPTVSWRSRIPTTITLSSSRSISYSQIDRSSSHSWIIPPNIWPLRNL